MKLAEVPLVDIQRAIRSLRAANHSARAMKPGDPVMDEVVRSHELVAEGLEDHIKERMTGA